MKKLTHEDVIAVIREEWDRKLTQLAEEVELMYKVKVGGKEINPIADDLKVKHRKSGILYTIDEVGPQDAVLITPEGDKFMINSEELENDYELD